MTITVRSKRETIFEAVFMANNSGNMPMKSVSGGQRIENLNNTIFKKHQGYPPKPLIQKIADLLHES
jgi:hypothetical protein